MNYKSLGDFLSVQAIDNHLYHYQKYKTNFSKLTNKSVDDILSDDHGYDPTTYVTSALYNNAAQIYNHSLWFEQFSNQPKPLTDFPELFEFIKNELSITSENQLKELLVEKGIKTFGSSWLFLLMRTRLSKLVILPTVNGGTYYTTKTQSPLLVIDLWEHAFYTDYAYKKDEFLSKMYDWIDWSTVNNRFTQFYIG